jgi:ABC-type sugar transport system ATPase subunit
MIEVENLAIDQGHFKLRNVSLEIPSGAYGVLMGATGSGKTTILEAVCGLRPIVAGAIRLPVGEATRLKPGERDIGYVPQDAVLFPHMTIADHLAFALVVRRWSKVDIRRRTAELAALLSIEHLLKRKTNGLSGGERQRVALGRALSFRPSVLCLDEPLSALDDQTREQMYVLLSDVRVQTRVTVMHVTHSRQEAQRLADVSLTMENGKVTREQTP